MNSINWKRIKSALLQEGRRLKRNGQVESKFNLLKNLIEISGEYSQNRKMIIKLGRLLLFRKNLIVLTPCCPDYSHENGSYTFRDMGGQASLLTLKHIDFLKKVSELFPEITPLIIIADAEVHDKEICRAVGKSEKEFTTLVQQSLTETRKIIPSSWQAQMMTTTIPNLIQRELLVAEEIGKDTKLSQRIITETTHRTRMYFKIKPHFKPGEMKQRTIRTAAQYVALGQYASQEECLVCNHTTTSLNWYLKTDVAVLHNPVSIY